MGVSESDREPSVWIVEREVDGRWEPLWYWQVSATEEIADEYMWMRLADLFKDPLRVREYVPRAPEPPSSARACDGVPRWAAS